VTVVSNGRAAVDAWEDGAFDLILMDVQMPILDGRSATREIRRRTTAARAPVPIVALTASAMSGELERCLAAGMDGLLTKPLEETRLREVLERFGLGAAAPLAAPGEPTEPGMKALASDSFIDLSQLQSMVGGDEEFVSELCGSFVRTAQEIRGQIADANRSGDHAVLASLGHKLKGCSLSLGAARIGTLASELEDAAQKKARTEQLTGVIEALNEAIDECIVYLQARAA
jgi:CheY-like chemotaxis protein